MPRLLPHDLPNFSRQYRFAGGRLLRVRQLYRNRGLTIELTLRVRPAVKNLDDETDAVKIKLRCVGVDEFRFQKRPGGVPGKLPAAHFGYFNGQFYVTLDDWSLLPGDRPAVFDFRGTDVFFGCRDLEWELVPPPSAGTS